MSAQSVLKIGSLLAEKLGWGEMAGIVMTCRAHGGCLAGCRKALVGTGWAISLLFSVNKLCRGSISGTVGSFQSGEAFAGQRALTTVGSLMSGSD